MNYIDFIDNIKDSSGDVAAYYSSITKCHLHNSVW